jgi:hypothetical protein
MRENEEGVAFIARSSQSNGQQHFQSIQGLRIIGPPSCQPINCAVPMPALTFGPGTALNRARADTSTMDIVPHRASVLLFFGLSPCWPMRH